MLNARDMMVFSEFALSYITNLLYDSSKNISVKFSDTYSKVYDRAIEELSNRYPKFDKTNIDIFLCEEKVETTIKEYLKYPNKPDYSNILINEFFKLFDEKYFSLKDSKSILNSFFEIIDAEIEKDPKLREYLKLYLAKITYSTGQETHEVVQKIEQVALDTKQLTQKSNEVVEETRKVVQKMYEVQKNNKELPNSCLHLTKKPISLFISYSKDDNESFVEKLYLDLKASGFDVLWYKSIVKGSNKIFLPEVHSAIEDSDIIVAIIGPKAIESKIIRSEWEHALLLNKNFIPVLLIGDHNLLPEEILELPCQDFSKNDSYEESLEKLIWILRKPLGPTIAIPSRPPNYLPRRKDLQKIKELVLDNTIEPVVITSTKQFTALQGMGGIGKSVLAAAFAQTTEARRAFPDGIFWITVGLEASDFEASSNMKLIGTNLDDETTNYRSKKEAEISLSKILSNKFCLIILDDVWRVSQVAPFVNSLGPHCKLLITTRNYDIVTSLGAQEHKIKKLSKREARRLLASWCNQEVDSLLPETIEVAKECGYLPLALSMCGAMAKSGTTWLEILDALKEADLEFIEAQLPNYPNSNETEDTTVKKVLKVSIDFLSSEDPNAVLRYQELVIFPADELVPEAAITTLWAHTGNLSKRNARRLLIKLKDRSLLSLEGESQNHLMHLHDLQFDYLRMITDNFPRLHNNLLEAYGKECGNQWSAGPKDGYFFEHLACHLLKAEKKEELKKLLLDFNWLQAKIEATDVIALANDFNLIPDDRNLFFVQGAIRLSAHVLSQNKKQIQSQLYGRLLGSKASEIKILLDQIKNCKTIPWLRTLTPSLIPPGGSLIRTLEGHTDIVKAVTVLPDGKRVISASNDNTLKVWDIDSGEILRTLEGHTDHVRAVVVLQSGKCAISASDDNTLKVWDIESGGILRTLEGHNGRINAVALMPDDKHAISASNDNTLKVWDIESGEMLKTLEGHESTVNAIAVIPDGRYAISASYDDTLKVWDLENGRILRTLEGHKSIVNAVVVLSDGKHAISTSWDNTLKVWDIESGGVLRTLEGHNGRINAVALMPGDKRAISASEDNTLKIWDIDSGEVLRTLEGHNGCVNAVAVLPDGKHAISASNDNTLKVWNIESKKEMTPTLKGHNHWVISVAVTPDGKHAISASYDNTLKVWNIESGEMLRTFEGHADYVKAVAVLLDDKHVISASNDNTLKVWDIESGKMLQTLEGHTNSINAIAVLPDGKHVISASNDNTLKVWDIKNGEIPKTLEGHTDYINDVTVLPDGKHVISASNDNTLKVWDIESGEMLQTLEGHDDYINSIAIFPDGKRVISASNDNTLKVWDINKGEEVCTLKGHYDYVKAVAVLPDGKHAISASNDNTLKVWDVDKGNEVYTFKGHTNSINAIAVLPDGKHVISASWDNTLKVWDIENGKMLQTLEGHTNSINAIAVLPDGKRVISASEDNTLKVWDIESGEMIVDFSGDSSLLSCAVSLDGNVFVAGEKSGNLHILHLEEVKCPITLASSYH